MINGFNGKCLEYVGQVAFLANKSAFLDFPANKVIKKVHFTVRGTYVPAYTVAALTINEYGIADGLIRKISIQRSGGDELRSYLGVKKLVNDQKLDFGDRGALLYKGNSATLGSGTSANTHVPAATTLTNSFYEAYPIYMENRKSLEYYKCYFSTLNNKSAKIIFDFNAWTDIVDPENAATVASITGDAVIDVYIETVDHLIGATDSFADEVHSYDQLALTGTTSGSRYTTSPQGELQGFWIRAVRGATEVRFTYEEMLATFFEFKFDGQTIWKGNLLDAAAFNLNDRPITDIIRGAAYINLLNSKTWETGLYTGEGANTKYIEYFSTCPYSNAKFYFEFDRIRKPKQSEIAKK
jgi:hypothetical protein